MATMYPFPVVEFKSPSEEKLYRLFNEKLSSDYSIFYGRSWTDRSNKEKSDVECDFIITKPESGILIIETKGGIWERKNGGWVCYGKPVRSADDPFLQARANKHSLIDLLKLNWSHRFFPVDYAIALPETKLNINEIESGLPNILTYDDIPYIGDWVQSAMHDCEDRNFPDKTDPALIEYLTHTLMRDYTIRLNDILDMDDKKLIVLTEQQLNLDRSLMRQKRLTVQGCAGSGKTLLAIRQVKRLAKEPTVRKIFFTCFNRELGNWLKQNTISLKDRCETIPFLDFCEHYASEMGVISDLDKQDPGYFEKLPASFLIANDTLNIKFDAIVVDEGQSFKEDWWSVLESMLKNKDSSYFYIFFDDFQRIYQEVKNPVPGETTAHELWVNIRNTARIHHQATKFLPDDKLPECNNIEGHPVWIHFYSNFPEKMFRKNVELISMKDVLRKLFHRLIQVEGISAKNIIILTPQKSTSTFSPKEKIGPYKLVSLESDENNAIRYTTIQSFRGMERQVVIITELDGLVDEIKSLIYLGCSRAKTKLIMLLSYDLDEEITSNLLKDAEDITGTI